MRKRKKDEIEIEQNAADFSVAVKKRNYFIPFIGIVMSLLMFALMAYIYLYDGQNKQVMFNNSYNAHQAIAAKQNYRGTIYADDGQILAITNVDDSGNEVREYPYESMFSHVVGYSSKGKAGIEAAYNYYLSNSHCSIQSKIEADKNGRKYPGDNLYTTLDVTLQKIAYDTLGMYKGAIIVTEPATGKILAMVSKPDFDPNLIKIQWDDLVSDKTSSVLLNRTTQGLYPPGSTFKIITALEYYRENQNALSDYQFQCNGSITAGGSRINCYHGTVHGAVDFTSSFSKSCNASFANMGLSLDAEQFSNTLDTLLFDKELDLGFPTAVSFVAMDEWQSESDRMQAAIGQGKDSMSPLHLNMITAAIANQGIIMKPYLVDRVVTDEEAVVEQFSPASYQTIMTADEAEMLKSLMTEVVLSGTAKKLSGQNYTAAGKTGSAEYNNVKGDSHAWFTGFAPVENPQICVTVIIEGAGSGGDYAVPLARRIFDAYLE